MTFLKWFKACINKPTGRKVPGEAPKGILPSAKDAGELQEPEALPEEQGAGEGTGREEAREAEKAAFSLEKTLILIADDHPVNQKLFTIIMNKLGYSPVLAGDGLEVLEKALTHPVSLVFMDIQMPRMNGYEAAAKLREAGFDKPIIAVTAGALEGEWERCRRSGMNDILLKPFKRPDIHGMIEKWLKNPEPPEHPEVSAGEGEIPSGFVIPIEEADIVPATKGRAELLGPSGGGSGTPVSVPANTGNAVFSSAEVLDTFLDNAGMAFSLLEHFLERTKGQIEGFPILLAAEDWEAAGREAHTIKGAALTLSGRDLGKAAARLEAACRNTDRPETEAAYKEVQEAFARFSAEAGEFLKTRRSAPGN
jgi:CheY-like chemotaxis protein